VAGFSLEIQTMNVDHGGTGFEPRSEHEANLELVEPRSVPSWMDPAPARPLKPTPLPLWIKLPLAAFYSIALAVVLNCIIDLMIRGSIISPIDSALLFVLKAIVVLLSIMFIGAIWAVCSTNDEEIS
jgi:hypothetical protein